MGMTKRRLQFLDKLNELYQRTNLPIHYETLANSLGVSKWTAYDMLKEIEKLGFVSRSYEVNSKETGRSQVLFSPTDQTFRLLREESQKTEKFEKPDKSEKVDWKKSAGKITALLRGLTHPAMSDAVGRVLDELPEKGNRLEYCGFILGVLSLQCRKLGGRTENLIRLAISKAQNKETQMILFAGTALGTVLSSVNEELGSRLAELVADFADTVQGLTNSEKEQLSELLAETLA
jgi:predicted transcriptional regulator